MKNLAFILQCLIGLLIGSSRYNLLVNWNFFFRPSTSTGSQVTAYASPKAPSHAKGACATWRTCPSSATCSCASASSTTRWCTTSNGPSSPSSSGAACSTTSSRCYQCRLVRHRPWSASSTGAGKVCWLLQCWRLSRWWRDRLYQRFKWQWW